MSFSVSLLHRLLRSILHLFIFLLTQAAFIAIGIFTKFVNSSYPPG